MSRPVTDERRGQTSRTMSTTSACICSNKPSIETSDPPTIVGGTTSPTSWVPGLRRPMTDKRRGATPSIVATLPPQISLENCEGLQWSPRQKATRHQFNCRRAHEMCCHAPSPDPNTRCLTSPGREPTSQPRQARDVEQDCSAGFGHA